MRPTVALLVVLAWVCLATAAEPEFRWEPLPASAAGEILLTGADSGFVRPNGCMDFLGGSFVRPGFERWLRERAPGAARIWISTGNVLASADAEVAVAEPEESFATLGAVPYAAVGVGLTDLERVGAQGLLDLADRHDVPLVATNVMIHETGLPFVDRSRIAEVGGRRIAFLAVTRHQPEKIWTLGNAATVVTLEPLEAVRAELASVRGRADRVVLLTTLLQGETRDLAAALEGVDLVVASAGLFRAPQEERHGSTRLYWAGAWGEVIGRLVVEGDAVLDPVEVVPVRHSFPIDSLTGEARHVTEALAP